MMLANPKNELIAKALSRGASYEEACAQGGYTGINATQAASICKRPDILARVDELQRELEDRLGMDTDAIEKMTPEQVRGLVTEDFLIKELVMAIKLSQTAAQFNATKSLIELLGKEIGMFGGNGAAVQDKDGDGKRDTNVIVNVLQNIHKLADMSYSMVDVTPSKGRLRTEAITVKRGDDE